MRVMWMIGASVVVAAVPVTFFGSTTGGGLGAATAPADQAVPMSTCPADVVADGVVDPTDLIAVLRQWGQQTPTPADITADGIVNQADLIEVIVAWGLCPEVAAGGLAMHVCALEDGSFVTADGGCKDLATGLVWSTEDMGFSGGSSWAGARDIVNNSNEAGFSDWRLPTVEELQTVLANGAETHFSGFPPFLLHWSDRNAGPNWAWAVRFWTGEADKYWLGGNIPSSLSFVGVRGGDDGGGDPPGGECNNDGNCDPGEDCDTCPDDCEGKSNGPPSGRFCCGNGVLEEPEGDGSICDDNP